MRIVSVLRGGLERRQSIFIPETFVKVVPTAMYRLRFHHAECSDTES